MYRVRREFSWDGKLHKVGDLIDIPAGHPRLLAMLGPGRYITFEESVQVAKVGEEEKEN